MTKVRERRERRPNLQSERQLRPVDAGGLAFVDEFRVLSTTKLSNQSGAKCAEVRAVMPLTMPLRSMTMID